MARSRQILVLALATYAICLNVMLATAHDRSTSGKLRETFYKQSCPQAESIVYDTVKSALDKNPKLAGAFLRMMFHDCFIRGCDASVLIDSTDDNQAEKDGGPNQGSLRGFEVLDEAKAKIEAQCPHIVSCADILVFAARDSVALNGGPWYSVAAGRRDGTVSLASETNSLPSPSSNAQQLTQLFTKKGLSQNDMVTLSGAHTIGQARCSVVRAFRLSPLDATLDPGFAKDLQSACPASSANGDSRIFMDSVSPKTFDNGYYKGLVANKGLFASDQTLYDDSATRHTVVSYSRNSHLFASKFVQAMGKLGAIDVKTGHAGEIRRNCHRIN